MQKAARILTIASFEPLAVEVCVVPLKHNERNTLICGK